MEQDPRILDLCTGSGCIGLAIARKVKDARVTLADVSREALVVAKKNAAAMKLTGRVSCIQADARQDPSAFLGTFDLIVSNPPYVRSGDLAALQPSVRDYEPILALDGGAGRPGLLPVHCLPLWTGPEARRLALLGVRHGAGRRGLRHFGAERL